MCGTGYERRGRALQVERVRDVLQDDVQEHIDKVGEAQCEGDQAGPLCLSHRCSCSRAGVHARVRLRASGGALPSGLSLRRVWGVKMKGVGVRSLPGKAPVDSGTS